MNWASNGVLGVESWQTTKLRQNVKTINNFMAEIEMWHLFVINFWLVCKQTREKYSSFIWSQTFVIFRIIFLSIDHSAPPPSSIKIQRVYIYHTHLFDFNPSFLKASYRAWRILRVNVDDWSYYLSIYDLDTVFNLHEKKM